MARVVIQAVVSVDGYIAYPDDTVGPLFDWYGNGDVTVHVNDKWPFHVSRASADYVQPFWDAIKVTVIGRHLFDTTDGWAGVPAAGDELVVVTHRGRSDLRDRRRRRRAGVLVRARRRGGDGRRPGGPG
jgi:dihydrofolate reductase